MLTLIYDISSIVHRVAKAQKRRPEDSLHPEDLAGLTMHISLMSINKWFQKYQPQRVVFAFEGANNWRKLWSKTNTRREKEYKSNRVYDPAFSYIYKLMDDFKQVMKAHTSVICLEVPGMEADDAIAAYCQEFATSDHQVYVVSGDKDFVQLTKNPNVKVVNPENGKFRNQPGDKDYEPDLDYWLFLKCVRGDGTDYVHSAYPKVRETKIRKAYESEYDRVNFMNEKWTDDKQVEHRVGDLFEENRVLVDLTMQPPELREYLLATIREQVKSQGKYAHFFFLGFCNRFKLRRVAEEARRFIDIFSRNQVVVRGDAPARSNQEVLKANNGLLSF